MCCGGGMVACSPNNPNVCFGCGQEDSMGQVPMPRPVGLGYPTLFSSASHSIWPLIRIPQLPASEAQISALFRQALGDAQ